MRVSHVKSNLHNLVRWLEKCVVPPRLQFPRSCCAFGTICRILGPWTFQAIARSLKELCKRNTHRATIVITNCAFNCICIAHIVSENLPAKSKHARNLFEYDESLRESNYIRVYVVRTNEDALFFGWFAVEIYNSDILRRLLWSLWSDFGCTFARVWALTFAPGADSNWERLQKTANVKVECIITIGGTCCRCVIYEWVSFDLGELAEL